MDEQVKVVYVLPIKKGNHDMPYAKRQILAMEKKFNLKTKIFYLENRSSLSYLFHARKRIKKNIESFQPSICHAHYGSVNGLFTVLSCKKPVIISFHGSDLNKTPTDGLIADFLARLFSNIASLWASQVIVVSKELKNKLWWRKKDVSIIPIGTNTNEFFPMNAKQIEEGLKGKYTFPFPTIVFNANNPKIKRLDIANKAIELLKKDFPNAFLFSLSGGVDPKDIPYILNASDLLLLCSDKEGSPTIIKEAMACNLPIVSTDVGDVRERLEKVNEALIVEQDPLLIYKAIMQILNSRQIVKNGRDELISQELDENILQKKIFQIYMKSISN